MDQQRIHQQVGCELANYFMFELWGQVTLGFQYGGIIFYSYSKESQFWIPDEKWDFVFLFLGFVF